MKKIYLGAAIVLALLSGCDSTPTSSEKTLSSNNYGTNTRMEIGKVYTLQKGDRIEKISDEPELKIDANLSSGKSQVVLLGGAAAIIRGVK